MKLPKFLRKIKMKSQSHVVEMIISAISRYRSFENETSTPYYDMIIGILPNGIVITESRIHEDAVFSFRISDYCDLDSMASLSRGAFYWDMARKLHEMLQIESEDFRYLPRG